MKKVYDYQQLIYIKNRINDIRPISIWKHLCLLDSAEVLNRTHKEHFYTFEELFQAVQEGKIWNAEVWYTCFLKRPMVRIICGIDSYYITKRSFTEVHIYHHYEDASAYPIKSLMRELKADEFVEYLRERGIDFLNKT